MISQAKAFDFYKAYLSTQLHFTKVEYNVKESKGVVRGCTIETFKDSSDYKTFFVLAKKYKMCSEFREICVANMLVNPKIRPTELLKDEAFEEYNKWISRVDSLCYTFKSDLSKIIENNPIEFFISDGINFPEAMKKHIEGTLTTETMVFLCRFLKLKKRWCKISENNPVFNEYFIKIKKYSILLDYNIFDVKTVLNQFIGEWFQHHDIK